MQSTIDNRRHPIVEALESRTLLSASYKVVDLGVLPGGSTSAAYGLNAAGLVVGNATTAKGATHGVKFSAAAITDIGTLPGGTTTHAYAVNAQGDVAGETQAGAYDHAFIYLHGVMRDLGTLGGHTSFAYAINDLDTVVGGSYIPGDKLVHAFVWTPAGGMKDLGTLGGGFSLAYAITAAGKIAGYSTNARGQNHAFINDGKMHDLGTLAGSTRSIAYAMNSLGQITGSVKVNGNDQAMLYSNGAFTDLGTLGGISSSAYGINHAATIVGASTLKGTTATHAFVYRAGKLSDLNQLIDPTSGWTLIEAAAINDVGQIVGQGMIKGHLHAFLLDPL